MDFPDVDLAGYRLPVQATEVKLFLNGLVAPQTVQTLRTVGDFIVSSVSTVSRLIFQWLIADERALAIVSTIVSVMQGIVSTVCMIVSGGLIYIVEFTRSFCFG
jgi:hypothetical protein